MRDDKQRRAEQNRPIDEAATKAGASRSWTSPFKRRAAKASGEDDLTRLIRIIARQAAQEAFSVFRDALGARGISDPPLLGRLELQHAPEGLAAQESGPPQPGERFLSVAEVSKKLGVSQKTVRRKIASGDWPAHRVGKLVRVNERVLTAHVTRAHSRKE
jgi:excisionase family DNA binding protein